MFESLSFPVPFRQLNHIGVLVYAGGNSALLLVVEYLVARPAADIQHSVARFHAGKLNDTNPDVFKYRVNQCRIVE
jgi:hypothetical protein